MKKVLFLLGSLSDADVAWLAAVGRRRRFARGEVLIQEGRPGDALYVVLEGRLSVTSGGATLASVGGGEVLGELSFLDARPPAATVTALGDVQALEVDHADLRRRLEVDPGFAGRFYRAIGTFLAARLRATVLQLGYGPHRALDAADALDDRALDEAAAGGVRFDWLQRRLRDARA